MPGLERFTRIRICVKNYSKAVQYPTAKGRMDVSAKLSCPALEVQDVQEARLVPLERHALPRTYPTTVRRQPVEPHSNASNASSSL